ncbi:MAG: hypothetical protein EOO38_15085 [Cytophagaceae bacterium]|nr:MAG: hypothetical protein EOO38_15085 [Cytophagaceae bacterium]
MDDVLKDEKKHVLADLHPSEVVTLGMLQALRGEGNRAFYRWVQKELGTLFAHLPERTIQGLKDDKPLACETCHRLLYYTEGVV